MNARTRVSVALVAALVAAATAAPSVASDAGPRAPSAGALPARVVLVQAVPGSRVSVTIDGQRRASSAPVGTTLGPFSLAPGDHEITFDGAADGAVVRTHLTVAADSSSDVVLHRPAAVDGEPVVNTYRTPRSPLGPDQARILLAHTATVAPADVRLDGKVVFTNIANGEYADAVVPAGTHRVALLPTGVPDRPILGPLEVTLQPRTVSMVYAVGAPREGSMQAIVHTVTVNADGTTAPGTIDTGSAGLVEDWRVVTFGVRQSGHRVGGGPSLQRAC